MGLSIDVNLGLPDTPKGLPEELFGEFRRLYSAIKNLAGFASDVATAQTSITPIQGNVTLIAGTRTVTNSQVLAGSRIFLSIQSLGTVVLPQAIAVTARTAGVGFTITSADPTDTSVISWSFLP